LVGLLAKALIKNYKSFTSANVRQKYGILCGILGIIFNIILFAGKLIAGMLSGSIAITADAFNNLSDAGSSVVTAVGFKLSGQKPDIHHPFGHGRIEYISGLIVSMIILLVGIELFKSSVEKIINPTEVKLSGITFIVLFISIAFKSYMAFYNNKIGKKISSSAMKAVARDSLSDCIATTSVLISMTFTYFTDINTDGWFGVLVALFILYTGYSSVKETVSPLLGQPPEPKFVQEIEQIVLSFPEIVGLHDLIVHDYGPGRRMISLHAEIPVESDILVMHDIIDNIEKMLLIRLECQSVIHMDPISTNDPKTLETKARIEELVKSIDNRITIHDFRMVVGHTHTNIIFDIVVPFDIKKSDKTLNEEVSSLVCKMDKTLYTVVDIDRADA